MPQTQQSIIPYLDLGFHPTRKGIYWVEVGNGLDHFTAAAALGRAILSHAELHKGPVVCGNKNYKSLFLKSALDYAFELPVHWVNYPRNGGKSIFFSACWQPESENHDQGASVIFKGRRLMLVRTESELLRVPKAENLLNYANSILLPHPDCACVLALPA
ncbi:MAG: hypothetical protein WC831_03735 [Parcubacteria group bacterium]